MPVIADTRSPYNEKSLSVFKAIRIFSIHSKIALLFNRIFITNSSVFIFSVSDFMYLLVWYKFHITHAVFT
jgi:hypothetical protein